MRAAAVLLVPFALAACAAPVGPEGGDPRRPALALVQGHHAEWGPAGAVIVTRAQVPFTYADGYDARRVADQACGGKVASGVDDNFRDGAWIFPGGCA